MTYNLLTMDTIPFENSYNTNVHPLIHQRRSLRAYDPTKIVNDTELNSLFEAARWAPSAFNEQPWRFIFARKGSTSYQKLFNALMPGNKSWAINAPVLLLAVVKLNSSHNDQLNRHAMHDLGLAMGMLSVQATSIDLNLHQMGGFLQAEVEKDFNIPAGYEAVTITSIGYSGHTELLPEALISKESAPRVRKELSQFVFENEWKH